MKKTILQHIMDIKDTEVRNTCLINLDDRYKDEEVYASGYAIMLAVYQQPHERSYWDQVYKMLNKNTDNGNLYFNQPIQQESHSSGKNH